MLPYWLFFLIPVLAVFSSRQLAENSRELMWWLVGVVFTLAIGLRYQVGADWGAYLRYLERAGSIDLWTALTSGDPGYIVLNWVVAQFGGGVHWVNLAAGAALMAGTIAFARRQPLPWLALAIAVPYLIIVVGMGYTRQAMALGFALLGLAALGDGQVRRFVLWVLVGAAFHKSVVILLPMAGLAASRNRWLWLLFGALAALIGGYLFLFDSVDALWRNYVEADYHSQGGLIRVLMNAVPAALFLLFFRRFSLSLSEQRLWWWMSVFAIACTPLVIMSSTATDRVALYLIPIQMFVFARLHQIVADPLHRAYVVTGVVSYYAAVLAVWLFFAAHAFAWLPYRVVVLN